MILRGKQIIVSGNPELSDVQEDAKMQVTYCRCQKE